MFHLMCRKMSRRFMASCSQSVACSPTSARWRCLRTAKSRAKRLTRPSPRTSWASSLTSLVPMMLTTWPSQQMLTHHTSKSSTTRDKWPSASTRKCNSRQTLSSCSKATNLLPSQPSALAKWSHRPIPSARSDATMKLRKKSNR